MAMQKEKFIQQFNEQLCCLGGDDINIAAAAYHLILNAEEPAVAFRYFLEHEDEIEPDGVHEAEIVFETAELSSYEKTNKLIKSLLDEVISEKPDVEGFYNQLWDNLTNEALFKDEKRRIYAFYRIWMDGRIPYYKLNAGITMTDEEFLNTILGIKDNVKKAIFIMNSEFTQKTERSSLIVDILKECETDREKAVVLSQAFSAMERNIVNRILGILAKAKEEENK